MNYKRIAAWILGLVGAVAVIGIGAIILLVTMDLRPAIERISSAAFDRKLTIAALHIGWGNPLSIELQGLQLANASWGSVPEMVKVERVSAEIDLWPLFGGVVRYRKLSLINPTIVLERDAKGTGNWHFSATASLLPGRFVIVPKNRTEFPTLIDLAVSDGLVTYRTSSGHVLRIALRHLAIHSAGDDQPATAVLDGDYDDTPVHLAAETQSFAAFRNQSVPFGATFSLTTPSAVADFKGTLTDPLNFDGVAGQLDIKAQKLGEFLAIFGADTQADFPLLLSGAMSRNGDHWQVQHAKGKLATSAFDGTLALAEGDRAQPDDASLDLDFAHLELNPLLAGNRTTNASTDGDIGAVSLLLEPKRATYIDLKIAAKQATYGSFRVADVAFQGRLESAQAAVSHLSFAFAGGRLSASGSAHSVAHGSHVEAHAALLGADAGQIARMIGAGNDQLAGKLVADATLEMSGKTLQEALRASRGHAVLAMTEGRVARTLLEHASTDLRALLRDSEGAADLTCLLAIVDLTNGIATISPLRLRTPDTTLIAGGTIDLLRHRLDLTVRAEADSAGLYALRIPLRVSGNFDTLSVQPSVSSIFVSADRSAANDAMRTLPLEMRQLAERNSCLH